MMRGETTKDVVGILESGERVSTGLTHNDADQLKIDEQIDGEDSGSRDSRGEIGENRVDQRPPSDAALGSIHTDSFAALLGQLGVSVAVTTYQAGFIVLLRHDGNAVNTHFRSCPRPMGLAAGPGRLAVGSAREVLQLHNMSDVTARLDGPQSHDACYVPRNAQITGDIDIHEMAWGSGVGFQPANDSGERQAGSLPHDELWLINTRFSCLCTLDSARSFFPRWRPPFISSLSPQDRCHLNGLAMQDGRPRYVTALGETDTPRGWRENKANGGVLIDVESNEIITRGLSMPHSPRWHDGRLWLLESGDGSIGTVDLQTGRYEAIAHVKGFTRGLSFVGGHYALVGVSQVRESATFSGIPITERLDPANRICGVSLIDLRSGREIGFVRFQDAVQEIFAVQLLPHRFPEILQMDSELLSNTYSLPEEALPDVQFLPEAEPKDVESKKAKTIHQRSTA